MTEDRNFTAFVEQRRLATGALEQVAMVVRRHLAEQPESDVLIFDDTTGRQVELSCCSVHAEPQPVREPAPANQGRAEPREVALLPRHWQWLDEEPGGASAALRRLVEHARKAGHAAQRARKAREAAGTFMWIMTGNLPGFEEASRALYARDQPRLEQLIVGWPDDLRSHVEQLSRLATQLDDQALTA